jgi:hypothetical protein
VDPTLGPRPTIVTIRTDFAKNRPKWTDFLSFSLSANDRRSTPNIFFSCQIFRKCPPTLTSGRIIFAHFAAFSGQELAFLHLFSQETAAAPFLKSYADPRPTIDRRSTFVTILAKISKIGPFCSIFTQKGFLGSPTQSTRFSPKFTHNQLCVSYVSTFNCRSQRSDPFAQFSRKKDFWDRQEICPDLGVGTKNCHRPRTQVRPISKNRPISPVSPTLC